MTGPGDVTIYSWPSLGRPAVPVAHLGRAEYDRALVHESAGPVEELLLPCTRQRFRAVGATHWRLRFEAGRGTVLEPCTVEGDGQEAQA